MDMLAKPDNKYYIFLFFVAMNAWSYSIGSHGAAFASTSFICCILIYFDYKTRLILDATFKREMELINHLERVEQTLSKLPAHDAAKFREIYNKS